MARFTLILSFLLIFINLHAKDYIKSTYNEESNLKVMPLELKKGSSSDISTQKIKEINPDIIFIRLHNKIDFPDRLFNYIEKNYEYFFVFDVPSNREMSIYLASKYEITNPTYENSSKVFHFIVDNESHIYTLLEKQTEYELQALTEIVWKNSRWDSLNFLLFKELDQIEDTIKLQELLSFNELAINKNRMIAMARPSGRTKVSAKVDSEGETSIKGSATLKTETKNGKGKFSGSVGGSISKDKYGNVKKNGEAEVEFSY